MHQTSCTSISDALNKVSSYISHTQWQDFGGMDNIDLHVIWVTHRIALEILEKNDQILLDTMDPHEYADLSDKMERTHSSLHRITLLLGDKNRWDDSKIHWWSPEDEDDGDVPSLT
jgi:hypothetical protein